MNFRFVHVEKTTSYLFFREVFRHGLFLGSGQFVKRIKSRYLPEKPSAEIPEQRRILKGNDPQVILKRAARIQKCDLQRYHDSAKISDTDKESQDLLIYLIWHMEGCTNQEIGNIFGLTNSSVSHRVGVVKKLLQEDNEFIKKFYLVKLKIER